MIYRQFVEQVKDAALAGAQGLRGSRDLTPFLHLESGGSVFAFPIDPGFFEDEESRARLVHVVQGLVTTYSADKVAWTFTGIGITADGTETIVCADILDREREELWSAPLVRGRNPDDMPALGGWSLTANEGAGFLVDPIQEALRR
jgi:hypothetical protein